MQNRVGIIQIPEARHIFPEMTVMANLSKGPHPSRAGSQRKRNLRRVFDLFSILEKRRNQMAKTLSGGEQQMLVIGRGLMSEPERMLMDDMSPGLDRISRIPNLPSVKKIPFD